MSKNKSSRSLLLSLVSTTFAAVRKGIGTMQLKLLPSGSLRSADEKATGCNAAPKKSPNGTSTAGVEALSQYIRRRKDRNIMGDLSETVHHMRCRIPAA